MLSPFLASRHTWSINDRNRNHRLYRHVDTEKKSSFFIPKTTNSIKFLFFLSQTHCIIYLNCNRMDVTPARRATSIIFSVLAGCLACFGGRNAFLDVEDIDHAWVVAASCFFFAITFRIGFWGWEQMLIGAEKSKLIPEFSSYFMAGFHGIGITAISFYLLSIDDDWHDFNDANTPAQNLALCISLGYFIAVSAHTNHP